MSYSGAVLCCVEESRSNDSAPPCLGDRSLLDAMVRSSAATGGITERVCFLTPARDNAAATGPHILI